VCSLAAGDRQPATGNQVSPRFTGSPQRPLQPAIFCERRRRTLALPVARRRLPVARCTLDLILVPAARPLRNESGLPVGKPPRLDPKNSAAEEAASGQPREILPSLCSKCFRHVGQYFLMANFSVIVRLFLVVW
jgi:hypothetical protein